jgi:hypothetical protein
VNRQGRTLLAWQNGETMKNKWKYAVIQISVPSKAQEQLDLAGEGGWELVSVVQPSPSSPMLAFFKMPESEP